MKNYIGTKKVQAEPMNECEAFNAGFTRGNKGDRDWKEGYKVVYEDGYELSRSSITICVSDNKDTWLCGKFDSCNSNTCEGSFSSKQS